MDVLDQVRELGDKRAGDDVNINKAREALYRETKKKKSSRKKWAWGLGIGSVTAAGGTAIAIGALTVGTVVTVSVVWPPVPDKASASVLLQKAAATIEKHTAAGGDVVAGPGQYLKITETNRSLLTLGPNTQYTGDSPFAVHTETDAIAGGITNNVSTIYVPSAETDRVIYASDDYHVGEIFGDAEAFENAWLSYYQEAYGASTDYVTEVYDLGTLAEVNQSETFIPVLKEGFEPFVPTDNYPTDPQLFLDQWQAAMDASGDEMYIGRPVGPAIVEQLSRLSALYLAPPEYRATLLRALALTDTLDVTSQDETTITFGYEDDQYSGSMTLDSTTGRIVSTWTDPKFTYDEAGTPVPVGNSELFPADAARFMVSVSFEVVDTTPEPTAEYY